MGFNLSDLNPQKWVDKGQDLLRSAAEDFVNNAKRMSSDVIDNASSHARELLPGASGAIGEITSGVKSLKDSAIDFLDPVSYAMDLAAEGLEHLTTGRTKIGTDIALTLKGVDRGEQIKKGLIDKSLYEAQVAAFMIPTGQIAKPIVKPLTKGVKQAKKAVKATTKGTPERVVAKHDLKSAKRTKRVGKTIAKNAARVGKHVARDDLARRRQMNDYHFVNKSSRLKARDWSKFGATKKSELENSVIPQRRN